MAGDDRARVTCRRSPPPTRGALFADLDHAPATGCPTTGARCSGTSRSSSGCWRARWDPARRCRSIRSPPPWSAVWTGCPPTSRSGCICATATTAISTSSSPSRSQLQVRPGQRGRRRRAATGQLGRRSPSRRPAAMQGYFAPLRDLDGRAGNRAVLRARALPPRRPARTAPPPSRLRLHRRRAGAVGGRTARMGHLHRMRDGTRGNATTCRSCSICTVRSSKPNIKWPEPARELLLLVGRPASFPDARVIARSWWVGRAGIQPRS